MTPAPTIIRSAIFLPALLLAGCASLPLSNALQEDVTALAPYGLDAGNADDPTPAGPPVRAWLQDLNDPLLETWVHRAVDRNFSLEEARYRVQAAEQQRIAGRAGMLPSLGLSAGALRSKNNRAGTTYSQTFDAGADLSWELDLWGKNYDSYKAADLSLQAEKASLQASRLSLAGRVARAWYQLVTSQLLTDLISKRVANLSTNLDIINNGYRQGINDALDVYLARSDLASERSNLSAQREQTLEATRQLQLLMGDYPSGHLDLAQGIQADLPQPPSLANQTLTTDSVRYRYDLQASFLDLAATDRQLAAAHKARFPSLTISASVGDSAPQSGQLFDGSSLAWNIIGGLTQPLFAGGRLQAREKQQLALLRQAEQRYLQALNVAFSEIEQTLTNDIALSEQLEHLTAARIDAEAAETLAFDKYRQGLVSYVQVLEAQRRAFSAQSSLLNLRNLLLQNRINMYLALGAEYRTES